MHDYGRIALCGCIDVLFITPLFSEEEFLVMPIFDFECRQCGNEFEKLVLKTTAPVPECAACESADVVKKVSAPGFRLTGSGWYETDFKTGKKKNLANSQGESGN